MDDLILREAAIEEIARRDTTDGTVKVYSGREINAILSDLPAVDAVPVVHARPVWINPLDPGAKICTWKCSSLCSACGDYVAVSWKYCPNCCAKIDWERRDT